MLLAQRTQVYELQCAHARWTQEEQDRMYAMTLAAEDVEQLKHVTNKHG